MMAVAQVLEDMVAQAHTQPFQAQTSVTLVAEVVDPITELQGQVPLLLVAQTVQQVLDLLQVFPELQILAEVEGEELHWQTPEATEVPEW
jgi:hypothetical protein